MIFSKYKRSVYLYILLTALIIISYDTYWFGTSGIGPLVLFRNIFIVLLPIILLIVNNVRIYKYPFYLLVYFIFVILLSSLVNQNSYGAPLIIISSLLLGLYLVSKYNLNEILSAFSNIILGISIYSVVIWFLCVIGIFNTISISNIADTPILSAYGCVFYEIPLTAFFRNSAIFREPGLFMVLVNLALLFDLFFNKFQNINLRILLYGLTILTMVSTGGIICYLLILLYHMLANNSGAKLWILMIIIIWGVTYALDLTEWIDSLFAKFETIESEGSAFARMSSIFVPLDIFTQYPLFGCGYDQFPDEYVKSGYKLFHRYIDSKGLATNTLMNLFAIWGVFVGCGVVYGISKFIKLITKSSKRDYLFFCMIFLMLFSNESMPYWPFIYIFIIYGVAYKYAPFNNIVHKTYE